MKSAASFLAVALPITLVAPLGACWFGSGTWTDWSTISTGGSTSSTGGSETPAQPPAPPFGTIPGDGVGSVTFAVTQLRLGDADANGEQDPKAWMHYGYNLDGKVSTASSTNVCAGADPSDGDNGIDNSFGRKILPLL